MTVTTDTSVDEGETFTVEAKSGGVLITDATVTINFAGTAYTTSTGTIDITAPSVRESLTYRVEATAEGYTDDDTTILVLNVPALTVTVTGTQQEEVFLSPIQVTVSDEFGNLISGATVTVDGQSETTVDGKASFEITEEKTYTITATFAGFADASVTIKAKPAGIPGFELLTLIAAIGVAFILLRRRRH
jgi:hypothetical protein